MKNYKGYSMKKINLNNIEWEYIKEQHLAYCKKLRFKNKKNLSEKDLKKLFIENPFDENMKLKRGYGKYKRGKTKVNVFSQYERFRSPDTKKIPNWYGAKLIKALKIDVCPYCGQQYFATIQNDVGKIIAEATFDHYYNKSENKFLALNLYNLIPVCRCCNSTYKLADNTPVVNPYIDDLGENIKFSLNNLDIPNYMNNNKIHVIVDCYSSNAENHVNILKIKERYEYYQGIIKSIIQKRIKYSPSYIKKITEECNLSYDFIEASLVKQDLFSDNEPFLKFKSDIWKQISD